MGMVYYGNYALYYEVARVEAIRALGLTYRGLEEDGILMPVVRMEVKYIGSATYDDELTIVSEIREMPDRFITFHVVIKLENGQVINRAKVILCFRDKETGKMIRTPSQIVQQLQPYFATRADQ